MTTTGSGVVFDGAFAVRGIPLQVGAGSNALTAALFHVKFTGVRLLRSVTIRPSNVAQYLRDDDADLVEKWLSRRGFIVDRTEQGLSYDVLESA